MRIAATLLAVLCLPARGWRSRLECGPPRVSVACGQGSPTSDRQVYAPRARACFPSARVVILRAVATPLNRCDAPWARPRLVHPVFLEGGAGLPPCVYGLITWHDDLQGCLVLRVKV